MTTWGFAVNPRLSSGVAFRPDSGILVRVVRTPPPTLRLSDNLDVGHRAEGTSVRGPLWQQLGEVKIPSLLAGGIVCTE